jgi:predicted RNA binding protein YcfA (HicA-like mRNA interferase family)
MFDERKWNRQHLAAMKVRAMIKLIEEDGWYLDRTRGSHRQYRHDQKKGVALLRESPVTILRRARKIVFLNKQD